MNIRHVVSILLIFIVSCVATSSSCCSSCQNGAMTCSGANCQIVGTYNNDASEQNAMIILSSDSGVTFGVDASITMPNDFDPTAGDHTALLGTVICQGQTCWAVGVYQVAVGSNGSTAFIVKSIDGGQTFQSLPPVPLPTDFDPLANKSRFHAISCESQNCIAIGEYFDTAGGEKPLAVLSTDNGATFNTVVPIPLPANSNDTSGDQELLALSCVNQGFVLVGFYNSAPLGTPTILTPFSVYSTDNGKTFSLSALQLPTDYNSSSQSGSQLGTVNCAGQTCIALGFYTTNANMLAPLGLLSTDGGRTFTSSITISTPADFNANAMTGELTINGFTCVDQICLAVGSYSKTASGILPLVLRSTDGGITFSSIPENNLGLPINFDPNGFSPLSGSLCEGQNCLIAGQYTKLGGGMSPLILRSTDSGQTFPNTSPFQLPSGAQTGATECAGFGIFSLACL